MSVVAKAAPFILLLLVGAWCVEALADPPPHAPAHGWRKKHDPYYVGYTGRHWEHDYDILSGRCNREAVATVLGSVVGAVVGSRTAEPEDRTVATIIGAAAGALIGNWIGRKLDDADRGCIGHVLEVGKSGQRVLWTNESTGVRYELVPGADRERDGAACREFTLAAVAGEERSSRRGVACQSQPGVWEIAAGDR
jgi:surface antigen